MVGARIVELLAVGPQGTTERPQFDSLMPVTLITRQPGGIQTDDQSHPAETHRGTELLKPQPLLR